MPDAVAGIADPLLEPAENLELELGRAGRLLPRADVDVARARDEIPERARPCPGERHVREEARVAGAAGEREDVAEERRQRVVERDARLGRGCPEPRGHLGGSGAPQRRCAVVTQPVDEGVDRAIAERAHLLRVERERLGMRPLVDPANLARLTAGFDPVLSRRRARRSRHGAGTDTCAGACDDSGREPRAPRWGAGRRGARPASRGRSGSRPTRPRGRTPAASRPPSRDRSRACSWRRPRRSRRRRCPRRPRPRAARA